MRPLVLGRDGRLFMHGRAASALVGSTSTFEICFTNSGVFCAPIMYSHQGVYAKHAGDQHPRKKQYQTMPVHTPALPQTVATETPNVPRSRDHNNSTCLAGFLYAE
jgi:hypothetical protein